MNTYNVVKIELETEKTFDYGMCNEYDLKLITRGYKFNGFFFERKNGKYIFIAELVE